MQLITFSVAVLTWLAAGAPEDPERAARLGAHLRVELLTMGPGTEAYSRFGHSALRVTDRRGKGDIVFNFGTFDHEDPAVISKFLAGTLRYWLSVSTYAETRKEYGDEKRRLIAQELRLTPLQRRRLFIRLYALSQPDRRHYRYHHFRANCSTRIRDVLDEVMGGALRRQLSRRPAHTYRHWLRRATRGAPAFHLGFDLVLTRADARISTWEACFAPEQLMRALASTTVRRQGRSQSFVASTRKLLPGPSFGEEGGPAPWTVVLLIAGLLLALAVVPLAFRPASGWAWRLTGVTLSLWGFFSTALSLLLIYVWSTSTLPVFTGNQNLLLLPPTAVAWIVLGALLAVRAPARWQRRRWLLRGGWYLAGLQGLVAVLYAGARVSGLATQGNTSLLVVTLPWALATAWILFKACAAPPSE